MSQKIFRVHLELVIDNISCPGVRLDSYGHLQFIVNAMDSTARSNHYAPYFPILANEKFLFDQDFFDQKQLSDIQYSLGKQFLFIELVQWQNDCKTNLLAMFKSTLLDLLYPAFKDKDLYARSQLDLVMIPFKSFPGVLGPKIEAFTKFRIETVCVPLCHSSRNSDHGNNSKTSDYSSNSESIKSQKNSHGCRPDLCEKLCLRKTLMSHKIDEPTKCAVVEPCCKKVLENIENRIEELRKINTGIMHKSQLFNELSKYNLSDLEHYINEMKINRRINQAQKRVNLLNHTFESCSICRMLHDM